MIRLRGFRFPTLVFALVTILVILKAWGYATVTGEAFDIAVFYQAWYSVLHGHILGNTVTTGIPYLAEHFVPLVIPTAPLALLPPNEALGAWWGLTIALLLTAAILLARSMHVPSEDIATLLLSSVPLLLIIPQEFLLWSVFAPIGYMLITRGYRKSGIAFMLLGILSMEYLPEYLVFTLDLAHSLNEYLTKRAKRIPWFAIAMILVVIAEAAYFIWVRHITGLANVVYKGHTFANPLSTIVPQHNPPFIIGLKVLSVIGTAPLIPAIVVGGLTTWVGIVLLILPFIPAAAFFATPFIYYLYPFYATSLLIVLIEKPWRYRRLMFYAGLAFLVTLLYIGISATSWFTGHGASYIPPPSPYGAIIIALNQLHLSIPQYAAVMTSGILCGYGNVLVLHCALSNQALTIVQPTHVAAYIALAKPLAFTTGNPAFSMNPAIPPGNYTTYVVKLSNRTLGFIYVPNSGNTTHVITVSPSQVTNYTLTTMAGTLAASTVVLAIYGLLLLLINNRQTKTGRGETIVSRVS